MDQHVLTDPRAFLLAGHAIVTVLNTATGNRLTYKVSQCADNPQLYFVAVLRGPNNTDDYTYLGTIRGGMYWHGKKSKVSQDAQSARGFVWLWAHLDALPPQMKVYHEGRCGRCGRVLTVPESCIQGYGPECIKHVPGATQAA